MSILRNTLCHVFFFFCLSLGSMSHVAFKKCPCRRVESRTPLNSKVYVSFMTIPIIFLETLLYTGRTWTTRLPLSLYLVIFKPYNFPSRINLDYSNIATKSWLRKITIYKGKETEPYLPTSENFSNILSFIDFPCCANAVRASAL